MNEYSKNTNKYNSNTKVKLGKITQEYNKYNKNIKQMYYKQ